MNEDLGTPIDRDALLERFVAELALAAYRVGQGPPTALSRSRMVRTPWNPSSSGMCTCSASAVRAGVHGGSHWVFRGKVQFARPRW